MIGCADRTRLPSPDVQPHTMLLQLMSRGMLAEVTALGKGSPCKGCSRKEGASPA